MIVEKLSQPVNSKTSFFIKTTLLLLYNFSIQAVPESSRFWAPLIKLARLRRNIPVEVIADRAGLGRTTVWSIEKGSPSVSMGAYAKVLHAIEGMDKDLLLICRD